MNSNNIIILLLGLCSLYLIKDNLNKYILALIIATVSVGICITKDVILSISLALVAGSLYTLFFQKKVESYEEFKINKEKKLKY